jgi:hypothetical protein
MLMPMLRHILLLLAGLAAFAQPRTLRLDFAHTGGPKGESFGLERVVQEPLPWPGNPAKALDESNLGKYRFEVRDAASGKVVYSRGFSSIYGEWTDTPEAQKRARTFSESLRFPAPEAPVDIVLFGRDAKNAWQELWRVPIDPKAMDIDRSTPQAPAPLIALQKKGDPKDKVDFLILGDGYTIQERAKFEADARHFMEALFSVSPYKEHRDAFNVWALCPASPESGISRPSTGVHHRSALGCTYDAFGSERYVLTFDNRALRDVAAHAPYEFVEILVNGRTYGGGGIYGLFSTVAADNATRDYLFVHEFGHHFAGLADEYYTSDAVLVPATGRVEPWEPNATADPKHPKWAALLTPSVPLPTPWKKAEFETYSLGIQKERRAIRAAQKPESEMEALFAKEKVHETHLLGTDAHSGQIGAFEGANYEATGYFRSQEDCIMFTRNDVGFCAACRAAIVRVIEMYAR